MNKAQAVALLLAGAAAGVGGKAAVGLLGGSAEAAPRLPFVHAADLRQANPTAELSTLVYGTDVGDAGTRDLGQAKSCALQPATRAELVKTMQKLAAECSW